MISYGEMTIDCCIPKQLWGHVPPCPMESAAPLLVNDHSVTIKYTSTLFSNKYPVFFI